jgi:hypothetical protein
VLAGGTVVGGTVVGGAVVGGAVVGAGALVGAEATPLAVVVGGVVTRGAAVVVTTMLGGGGGIGADAGAGGAVGSDPVTGFVDTGRMAAVALRSRRSTPKASGSRASGVGAGEVTSASEARCVQPTVTSRPA